MADDSTVHRPASEIQELDRAECLRLLAGSRFGRVGVSAGDGAPMIRPLNYVFDDRSQSVAFRTTRGSKLHALLGAKSATFEVDHVDVEARTGWSVIIVGVTEEVTNPIEVRRLNELGLDVWAPGDRSHWVRIRAWTVSGRRVVGAGKAP
jgi:uncharacterized protein